MVTAATAFAAFCAVVAALFAAFAAFCAVVAALFAALASFFAVVAVELMLAAVPE